MGPLDSSVVRDGGIAGTSHMNGDAGVVSSTGVTPFFITSAPATGQKTVIDDIIICSDTAMRSRIYEETSSVTMMYVRVPAGVSVQITPRGKLKFGSANTRVGVVPGASGVVDYCIFWHSEP